MKKTITTLLILGVLGGAALTQTLSTTASAPVAAAKKTKAARSGDNKQQLISYLEIKNDQTGKAVRYAQVYATGAKDSDTTTTEGSGWQHMTYADLPSFPRYNLTAAEIQQKVEAVGVTATNGQTWSVTQYVASDD
ncbi:hypothetical protein [Lacticaseibacillus daqingensis]|uniref:hypothetical protein n=1 Tax=Lacticaseibacillus daqingensis TaxID=2486014 RepID=UPI000F7B970D|nr:hypothetical protein [Lacticaseibacillus daqingensis]